MKRPIILIDESLCDGCGQCIMACAEGALELVDGKAKLVGEVLCDGLGACLGDCPQGALVVEEREADEFDEAAVKERLAELASAKEEPAPAPAACGCPGAASRDLRGPSSPPAPPRTGTAGPSELSNWPIQIHLAPPQAPYFDGAKLLIAADCVPGAYPDFHAGLLAGRRLLIGCPKLDDTRAYFDKLTAIFTHNDLESVEVAFMEVPCCSGLVRLVQQAMSASGRDIQVELVQVGIDGQIRALNQAA